MLGRSRSKRAPEQLIGFPGAPFTDGMDTIVEEKSDCEGEK